jgi:hypothetical protein
VGRRFAWTFLSSTHAGPTWRHPHSYPRICIPSHIVTKSPRLNIVSAGKQANFNRVSAGIQRSENCQQKFRKKSRREKKGNTEYKNPMPNHCDGGKSEARSGQAWGLVRLKCQWRSCLTRITPPSEFRCSMPSLLLGLPRVCCYFWPQLSAVCALPTPPRTLTVGHCCDWYRRAGGRVRSSSHPADATYR